MRIVFVLILLVVLVVAGFFWANRPQLISINAAVAPDFPAGEFDHSHLEALLQRHQATRFAKNESGLWTDTSMVRRGFDYRQANLLMGITK